MSTLLRRLAPGGFAAGLLCLLAAPLGAQAPADDPILARMKADVYFLAGPECEGRGIETKGIEKAADHIAASFKASGLKPAMPDGSYFQPFPIVTDSRLSGSTLTLTNGKDTRSLILGKDYSPLGFSTTSKASAGLVFVGYGITAKELKYDDYAGVEVEGKIVVMLRRTPRPDKAGAGRFDTKTPANEDSPHAAYVAKIENAIAHKAAGIIIASDAASAARNDPLIPFGTHARSTETAPFPVMHVKREVLDKLLADDAGRGLEAVEKAIDADLKPQSRVLAGWKAETAVEAARTQFKAKNVIGVLDGAGPLANETVVIGAHYDHLGFGGFGSMDGPKSNGKIHYGADDNASGTSGVLELARRYGAMKNRQGRRLVFITFSGEERNLLGSAHYCKHPVFPLESTVAMLNMDMIGRTKPVQSDWLGIGPKKDRLMVYGLGSSDGFEKLVFDANKAFDFRIFPKAAGTGPSDHDSYYRKNIPVLFFYTGTHGEYHRPTDTPDTINYAGMKKVVGLVEVLADHMLTTPTRPKWLLTHEPWTDPSDPRSGIPAGPRGPVLRVRIDYNYDGEGVFIEGVTPGGPAEKGGMKDGDLIVEIAGKPTKNVGAYMTAMAGQKAGQPVEVVVDRKGKKLTLKIVPE